MHTEFWLSSSDNLASQNLACGSIWVLFFFSPWHLKVWINGCGKSVAVAAAVLILIISYSIRAPGGNTTDWETDRQARRHTAGWIIRGRGRLGDIKRHSLGDHWVSKWHPTSKFMPQKSSSRQKMTFHMENWLDDDEISYFCWHMSALSVM